MRRSPRLLAPGPVVATPNLQLPVWWQATMRDLEPLTVQHPGGSPNRGQSYDLEALYRDHAASMYQVAAAVVRNPSLAEDIVQESLIRAWLGLHRFRGDAHLRTWLLRIVHNAAVSELRRLRDTPHDPLDLPDRLAPAAETEAMNRALMIAFENALFELDELSRAIVTLRELEGLAYAEISEILDVSETTVRTRLFRARRELMDRLRAWREQS